MVNEYLDVLRLAAHGGKAGSPRTKARHARAKYIKLFRFAQVNITKINCLL